MRFIAPASGQNFPKPTAVDAVIEDVLLPIRLTTAASTSVTPYHIRTMNNVLRGFSHLSCCFTFRMSSDEYYGAYIYSIALCVIGYFLVLKTSGMQILSGVLSIFHLIFAYIQNG